MDFGGIHSCPETGLDQRAVDNVRYRIEKRDEELVSSFWFTERKAETAAPMELVSTELVGGEENEKKKDTDLENRSELG